MIEAIVIGAIIQLITLIVFFVMGFNIEKIRRELEVVSGQRYMEMAEEEKYIGNKEKAKEYLLRAKYRFEIKRDKHPEYILSAIIPVIDKKLSEL